MPPISIADFPAKIPTFNAREEEEKKRRKRRDRSAISQVDFPRECQPLGGDAINSGVPVTIDPRLDLSHGLTFELASSAK